MKIKTVKKLNLPELIQYVWENDIESTYFLSNEELMDGKNVRVHVNPRDVAGGRCAGVSVDSGEFVVDDSYTFTVTVEEELTEDTKLPAILTGVKGDDGRMVYRQHTCMSIKRVKEEMALGTIEPVVIYATDRNIPMHRITLVWSAESGIPESGVLEVGAE